MLLRFLLVLSLSVICAWPQNPTNSGQPSSAVLAAFEIADVHPSAPSANARMSVLLRGARYEIRQATMLDLIVLAYVPDGEKLVGKALWSTDRGEKVAGGPPWLDADRFDITAKIPSGSKPADLKE